MAVPEVVQSEVRVHLAKRMKKFKTDLESAHHALLVMFGRLQELKTPSDADIDELAASVVDGLGVPTRVVPFTLDAARASLDKIIHKRAPSKNRQQFKDGVIWANCIELLAEDEVWLVTDDRDFFEGGDKSKGLAHTLWEEAKDTENTVRLFSDLRSVLKEIRHDVELSDNTILDGVLESERDRMGQELDKFGFAYEGEPVVARKKLFATTEPTKPYCDFEIQCPCVDITGQGRTDAVVQIEASASYNSATDAIEDVKVSNLHFRFTDAHGKLVASGGYVNLSFNAHAGARTLTHAVRVDPWDL